MPSKPAIPIQQTSGNTRSASLWIFAFAVLLTLWAYRPGLLGGYVLDDLHNIVGNDRIAAVTGENLTKELTEAAISSRAGLLRRPVSMLSFALNHAVGGMNPYGFKLTNVAIHLLTGLFAFLVCRQIAQTLLPSRLTGADAQLPAVAAAFSAGLWLLHPLNVSSVLYVVQRMTELSTLFTLIGLYCYMNGRMRMLAGERGLFIAVAGMVVFGTLAVFSKENGALIVVYAFVLEILCFGFRTHSRRQRWSLLAFYGITLLLPIILVLIHALTEPAIASRLYFRRAFSLEDRLLTQCRVIWHYVTWIFVPAPSFLGLFHDDIQISRGLISPPTTLAALLAILAIVATAAWKRRSWPLLALAVFWFIGGHLMESTVLPLEIAFEHRNYLPMLGPLLAATILVMHLGSKAGLRTAYAALATVLVTFAVLTHARAQDWRDPQTLAFAEARHHPMSARANYEAGRTLATSEVKGADFGPNSARARQYFERAMAADPNYALAASGLILSYIDTPEVPQPLVDELCRRLRTMPAVKTNAITGLLRAQSRGKLPLTNDQAMSLMTAVLENPKAIPLQRALALNELGKFHLERLGDRQSAISYTMAAAEQAPSNPLFRVNIANLALALDRPDIARQSALEAKKRDTYGLYSEQIETILSDTAGVTDN